MKRSFARQLAVFTLLAALAAPGATAQTCPTPGCDFGLTGCTQYVRNPELVHGCGWTRATTAGYVDLTAVSRTLSSEDFTIPADEPGNLYLHYEVEIFPSNPGTERMYVELMEGFTVLHLIDDKSATSSGGEFDIPINDIYKGKTVYLRFRRVPGSAQGSTTFRVQKAYLWALVQQ